MYLCVCLCELLLGVSPRSSVCVPERAVARSFSMLRFFVDTFTHMHTHSYTQSVMCMCAPGRAVARSFSTFRLFVHVCVCLGELLLGVSPRSGFFV